MECYKENGNMSAVSLAVKRMMDVMIALVGLIVFSPVFLVIYVAVKCEDGGKVFFSQERIGLNGKPFHIYKFRSMITTAEDEGVPMLCKEHDDRLTRTGRFLREHHLDELPQLWNVLCGDMSFVGYRPERKYFIDQIMEINPDYAKLYALRPGVFSFATLYNGYTDTMDKMLERLRLDLDYMRNRSLWLDVKIVFLTVSAIFTGKKF
ncbi:MAG: sugar transferase [Bacteroides sp.]|nr:sugar transferase [Roseburia sp.]MCM1346006.1 sugar transferase [Bacteroides sp.]MCM1420835.1 sugar transferase [Bacteroides sp.]